MTSVFKRSVRDGSEARYEDWLTGIAQAAARSSGSQGTTILQPTKGGSEYVAITQFETAERLEAWLSSAEREGWMSKLRDIDVCREHVSTLAGMERWFTNSPSERALPPRYKTAVLVLLGLYPLVLLLDVLLGPLLSGLPRPVGLLISLLISVSIMVGGVLPLLTRMFRGWLHPGVS
ncbi:MAG: antibiotic biosynthesis monooxygenase [Planctomycetota bacterium]